MLKVTQSPQGPIQVKQQFTITGVADKEDAGKTLNLTIDNQFKATGPAVYPDGTWRLDFLFQQAGNRRLEIELDKETVVLNLQVVTTVTPTPRPPRLRFTQVPASIEAEETFSLSGEADQYADGDQLILRADRMFELARPRVQGGKWQAPFLVFRQTGSRLIEIIGSEQDRAQITVTVKPATLQIIARTVWTNRPTPADLPALQPRRITLHHTDVNPILPTNASQAAEADRMRQIWQSHVQGNGWSDIGYHFIIMPSGRIYEARSELKRGAHDVINDGLGIAFDGTYTSVTISQAQFQSAVALCTKLCQRYGFKDPVTPVPTPTADFGTRNIPLICGHRDRVSTACPGSEGGRTVRLDEIRQTVKTRL